MTSVPPLVPISYSLTRDSDKRQRQIERDYDLALTAASVDDIRRIEAANLIASANAARANLAAQQASLDVAEASHTELREINSGIARSNSLLADILSAVDDMADELANVHGAIERQTEMQRAAFLAVHAELTRIAGQLLESHHTLKNIEEVLRSPYEAQVRELSKNAIHWIDAGKKHSGREQSDDFDDAFQQLEEIIKIPKGNQDYVTWFQIGWLRWKHHKNVASAEEAFYRAARLSAPTTNAYHVTSLRHWAYMLYLQQKFEDAYQTIQRAVVLSREHDVLFDAARYASLTGRNEEAVRLLDECIELRPTTIVEMFAEEDFQ